MKILVVFALLAAAGAPFAAGAAPADNSSTVSAPAATPAHKIRQARHHRAAARPTPTPISVAAPVEKKHSWIYWLFHPRPKPAPTPIVVSPTPTPAPLKKARMRTKTASTKSVSTATPNPTAMTPEETGNAPMPTPASRKSRTKKTTSAPDSTNGLTEPAPFVPDGTSGNISPPQPRNTGAQDSAHFRDLRARALADKRVQELQSKSDNAPEGDEQRKAAEEYYHALFNKMRQLDPSFKDRLDRTEAATLRRL